MPKFIMMVGLPGSGKSTWAKEYAKTSENETVILSSDAVREELFESRGVNTQTSENHEKVFTTMFHRAKTALAEGKNVVYDATNLKKKNRIHVLRGLQFIQCQKICQLLILPYEECLRRNRERDDVVPEEVIWRMYTGFQPPHGSEGWDYISVEVFYGSNELRKQYSFDDAFVEKMESFEQNNPHHQFTLGEHQIRTQANLYKWGVTDAELLMAALFHDIGKMKTRITDEHGVCHYYQHHSVGAYDIFLLYWGICTPRSLINVSNYIYYHMHPFLAWSQSEQAKEKDKKLLGEEMFEKIMMLHRADIASQKERSEEYGANRETVSGIS